MNIKEINWYETLLNDVRLDTIALTIYDQEEINDIIEESSAENFIEIGESEELSNFSRILLSYDANNPEKIRVSLGDVNNFTSFYITPTFEALANVYRDYIDGGLYLHPMPGRGEAMVMRQDAKAVALSAPNKKEITFFLGLGEDWNSTMIQIENGMLHNPFVSTWPMVLATHHGNDGDVSQNYTSYSASLCSTYRIEEFGGVLFFLKVEYIPMTSDCAIQVKNANPEHKLLQKLPNDIPIDIIGMLMGMGDTLLLPEDLVQDIANNDFDSLLTLMLMTELTGDFEAQFFPLASHKEQKFRNQIALAGKLYKSQNVMEEAVKHGVSEEVMARLKA